MVAAEHPIMTNIWLYGGILMVILTGLTWVRDIAKFRFTFLLANIFLWSGVLAAMVYGISKIRRDGIA
jgi:hypothetical protein